MHKAVIAETFYLITKYASIGAIMFFVSPLHFSIKLDWKTKRYYSIHYFALYEGRFVNNTNDQKS